MAVQQEIGDKGEEIALEYLIKKGYRILETKWHFGHLELDIVAKDGDELVIVEVKTRSGIGFEHPSEALSKNKIRMIVDAAEAFIQQREFTCETRFDLVTVVLKKSGFELEHYEEAFYPML